VLDRECKTCDFSKLRQTVKETAGELLGGVTEIGTLAPGAAPEREASELEKVLKVVKILVEKQYE